MIIRALASATVFAWVGAAHLSYAQEKISFDIPAQSLMSALDAFSDATGISIVYMAGALDGLQSNSINANLAPSAALSQLTAGADVDVVFLNDNTVRIVPNRVQVTEIESAEDGADLTGEDIIVTARRTEEALFDVPGSIVVLSREELEKSNLKTTDDVLQRLPNVSFVDGSTPTDLNVSIRGVSNLVGPGATGPVNGIFLDGVLLNPTGSTAAINPRLLDIQRVETAFGPQGTAFGRGTIGGAINFVPNKPSDEFEAELSFEVGSRPDGEVRALINGAILPDGLLSARFVAFGSVDDGFVEAPALGGDVGRSEAGARISFLSEPNDRLQLELTASFDRTKFDGQNTATIPSIEAGDPVSTNNFFGDNALNRYFISGKGTYDFDFGTFKSTASYLAADVTEGGLDVDFSELDFTFNDFESQDKALSQEFRFESKEFDLPNNLGSASFNVGANVSFSNFDTSTTTFFGADAFLLSPLAPLVPTLTGLGIIGPNGTDGSNTITNLETDVFNFGVFADLRWEPIDGLEVAGGVRFIRDRVIGRNEGISNGLIGGATLPGGIVIPATIPSTPFAEGEEVFTAFTPNASIRYEWTENFSTYLSYATGFRPGGFSTAAGLGLLAFDEERARNFEGGFRASFFEDRLRVSGTGFFLDYDDIQVNVSTPVGPAVAPTGFVNVVDNAAAARSIGAEFTLAARPFDGFLLDMSYGLNFSKFTDFVDPALGDFTDDPLPNAPRHTFSLAAEYEHPIDEFVTSADAFVRTEFSLRSDFKTLVDVGAPTLDGFELLNFRVGVRGETFEVEGFVENALNEVYGVGSTSIFAPGGVGSLDVGSTRRFGVRGKLFFY
ncbi:MAG: TonB-dependent receptor [Pseudomonadota bacterium]